MTHTPATYGPEWEPLLAAARAAATEAYAPYSGYRVGAAARAVSGELFTGANVENASYGLTLCAECAVVTAAARARTKLSYLVCVHDQGDPIAPCGRCRQIISEHAAPGCEVLLATGPVAAAALLPHSFGPDALGGVP